MRRLYLDIETLPAHETKHEILKFLHAKKKMKKKSADIEEESKDFEQKPSQGRSLTENCKHKPIVKLKFK